MTSGENRTLVGEWALVLTGAVGGDKLEGVQREVTGMHSLPVPSSIGDLFSVANAIEALRKLFHKKEG